MRRSPTLAAATLTAAALLAVLPRGTAGDWTRFRGPDAGGVGDGTPAPLEMRPDTGFVWKRPVAAGKSSPVLAGSRLFFTAYEGDRLLTIALDRATGETLWTRELQRSRVDERSPLNDAAVPTPVTDGGTLYVFFADFGLAAYSVDGRELWRRPMGPFTGPHGIATSPLLVEGMIVLMLEQIDDGAVIGVDASTGELKWSSPRPISINGSFATPVAYRTPEGETQVVLTSPFELAAYDPKTGEKQWRVGGLPHQPKSSPVVVGDLIVVGVQGDSARNRLRTWEETLQRADRNGNGVIEGGEIGGRVDYDQDGIYGRADHEQWRAEKSPASRMMAVRPHGHGDLTSQAVVWSVDRGVPRVTTPLAYNGVLYLVRNGGIFVSYDLATGEIHKQGRLRGAIDEYFVSPVAVDGKILVASRDCKFTWIEAKPQWEVLQVNDLGGECFPTPALGHDGIFVRTSDAIYRFATGQTPTAEEH